MKRYVCVICICLLVLSCGPNGYKAEEEIQYLQNKLNKIKSLSEEASYNIADLSERNEDAKAVYDLIEEIEKECEYKEYHFYCPD